MTPIPSNRRAQVRSTLQAVPDGMTVKQLSAQLNATRWLISSALSRMPDVYIDRWKAEKINQPNGGFRVDWVAVYCLCDMPADAPRPDRRATEDDLD